MEIISPWEIYLILQLDTIKAASFVMFVIGGFIATVVGVASTADRKNRAGKKFALAAAVLALFFGLLGTVLPSTTTAAAIVLIPKIANSEVIQEEASELYQLAKQGLRRAVSVSE